MVMIKSVGWPEVESRVHRPLLWAAALVGLVLLLLGAIGFVESADITPAGMPPWIPKLGAALVALLGAAALAAVATVSVAMPLHVRHAAPEVLPDVPGEPLILERVLVCRTLTHELVENADAWRYRPTRCLSWRNLGQTAGITGGLFSSGTVALSWAAHDFVRVGDWPLAVLYGTLAAAALAGLCAFVFTMLTRASQRTLCELTIPLNGESLEFDSTDSRGSKMELIPGLAWSFQSEGKRQRLKIPRELVAAVQLCPWKYVYAITRGNATAWAVQGLLVLSAKDGASYCRLPILLTCDVAGAARLMRRLSEALEVPYLYHADADGWKAEKARAQDRHPLREGGLRL